MEIYRRKIMALMVGVMVIAGLVLGSSISHAAESPGQLPTMQNESMDSLEEDGEIPAEEGEGVISDDDPSAIGPSPRAVSSMTLSFTRLSSTSAKATLTGKGTAGVKNMKSTISLQKKNKSTGKYATVSGTTRTKTVSGRSISHAPTYSIKSGQSYRVKGTVTDGSHSVTRYAYL